MIARLRSELNMSMKKRFDRNHVVKNIGKKLYSLKTKKLSKSVIEHIQKCLKYSFAKHQGGKQGLKENLTALIPHQFGDHDLCVARFCGFKRNPKEKYTHRSLPYKAALKNDNLRAELDSIFQPVIANAEAYSDLGSSQQCEHANKEVTLRAPKSHHYGNSESLDHRVQATAAFINEGRSYISQVNTACGLSPGQFTKEYAAKTDQRRRRKQASSKLPSTKRRRLILKQESAIHQGASEALEGQSCQSGIGMEQTVDIEHLSEAVPRGVFKPVSIPSAQDPTFIMFDLETTDLIRGRVMPHITQIAAIELQSAASFNSYVRPKLPVTSAAQDITGIVVNQSGLMTVKGQPVEGKTIQSAVTEFLEWLNEYPCVVLVAHNGRKFDFPVFLSTLKNVGCEKDFFDCVTGLIDSLTVFKKAFPGQDCYKQEHLVKSVLHSSYLAHDAMEDVRSLGQLVKHTGLPTEQLVKHSYPPLAVHNSLLFSEAKARNIDSLGPLIFNGVMKDQLLKISQDLD